MAGADIFKQAGQSVLGMIEKAHITIEDKRFSKINVVEGTPKMVDNKVIPGYDASLARNGAKLGSFDAGDISAIKNVVTTSDELNTEFTGIAASSRKTYKVRFNPSTLSISAYGGGRVAKTSFDGNQAKIVYEGMEPTICLNVQLVFDAENDADCFMNEAANVKEATKKAIKVVRGKRYSVQNQVEGFIAALRNPYTRRVTFSWGQLSYRGVLTDVDAEYTMFSIHGRPVRALVNLVISCTDEEISAESMGQWKKSFETAFSNSATTNLESASQNVSNLINFNF